MKLVTVIIPVYNSEKYIYRSISSILKQTYQKFELIIIYDKSDDNSLNVIKGFKDYRIKLILNKERGGVSKARNQGIVLSKGVYIAFLDADDYSHSKRLKMQIVFLENNPNYGIVGSWVKAVSENSRKKWRYPITNDEIKANMIFENSFATSSVMIRKEILIKNQLFFKNNFDYSEDYELWIRILNVTSGYNINKFLTYYQLHENQNSKIENMKIFQNSMLIKKIYFESLGFSYDQRIHENLSKQNFKNIDFYQYFDYLNEIKKLNLITKKIKPNNLCYILSKQICKLSLNCNINILKKLYYLFKNGFVMIIFKTLLGKW